MTLLQGNWAGPNCRFCGLRKPNSVCSKRHRVGQAAIIVIFDLQRVNDDVSRCYQPTMTANLYALGMLGEDQ